MFKRALIATALTGLAITSVAAQTATPPSPAPAAAPTAAAPAVSEKGPQDPAAKARFEKFRAVCGSDIQKHCGTVERGNDQARGQMRQCVEANKAKFSTECQAAVVERDANREARKQAAPATSEKPKS